MKSVNVLLVIGLFFCTFVPVHAALKQPSFTNAGGDNLWNNSANWSMGEVPGDSAVDTYDAWLSSNGSRAIIDVAVPDIGRVRVGQWGNYGELEIIDGGSLTIVNQGGQTNGEMVIGLGTGGGGTLGGGKLYMSGGTLNIASNLRLGAGNGFGSELHMSGGTLTFNIDGNGTLFISDTTSFIDITGGTIIWKGDHLSEVGDLIGANKIISSTASVSYSLVGGDTYIVPEPATLVLLSIGGLLLRRRVR